MAKPLRVLIVEDSEDDALLVIRELKRGGNDVTFKRVETAEAMTAALVKQAWDIIISDYRLPHFSAPESLELLHQSCLDLPFIVISGTIGEETAVEMMKAGAHDYLMKDNLTRLVPAIERELREAEVRKKRKQAEEALKESEENLKAYLENAPDGIYINDLKGTFLYGNKRAEALMGHKREELIGKSFLKLKLLQGKYLAKAGKLLALNAMGRPTGPDEFELMRKDGNRISVEINTTPIKQEKRTVVIGLVRDITERKQAEDKIRESRDYLERLTNSMWDTVFLVRMPERVIEWVNDSYNLIGYDSEECVGSTTEFLYHNKNGFLDFGDKLRNAIESGKDILHSEQLLRRKSGEVFPADITATIIRNRAGKVASVTSIIRDISERKKAADDLKQAAEEWRMTFDSITDLVSIHDKDFKLVRVNKAFADIFSMKPKELVGKTCYQVVHGTNECVPNCPHMETLETKEPAIADFLEPHLGIYLEVATSPIFNEKGEVVASVHVARDITKRKRMEERLMVTDRLASIGELASGVAHELNNPLTSVIGFSDLLLARDLPDDIKEDLKVINREAQRTAGIVKNLLTFARKHEAEKKLVNINELIQKVLELRTYEQKVNNIQTNTQFSPDLPKTMADSFQLQQVFINIIINAEHFMGEAHRRGTLTITTERAGDIIRASFADDGPGIHKENLGHLFDPFFTTKEVGKGTGLGLSICHGIITEHGGRIYAESELGKGATFVVELPVTISDKGGTNK